MEYFWIAFTFASLIIAGALTWLLKWLKSNYPQAYENDPIMAGLGGIAAVSVIASSKLPIGEPFHVVIGMIPVFLVLCFLLSTELYRRLRYLGLVTLAIVLIVSIQHLAGLGNWFVYSSVSIVFACLWIQLFRVRYVLKDESE